MKAELKIEFSGTVRELVDYLTDNVDYSRDIRMTATLEAIGQKNSQLEFFKRWVNKCGHYPCSGDLEAGHKSMLIELGQQSKIGAIKEVRHYLGTGLKEAKDIVEAYAGEFPFTYTPKAY